MNMTEMDGVREGELQPVDSGNREDEPITMTTVSDAPASSVAVPSVAVAQPSSCNSHLGSNKFVVEFDDSYLKSLPGVVRFLQIVSTATKVDIF